MENKLQTASKCPLGINEQADLRNCGGQWKTYLLVSLVLRMRQLAAAGEKGISSGLDLGKGRRAVQ